MANVDQAAMLEAVLAAGLALQDRLERLEVRHGSVGLMFLTDTDADLIKRALLRLRSSSAVSVDRAHVNVLAEEMRIFIEGLQHEISEEPDGTS